MTGPLNPFEDRQLVRDSLYAEPDRMAVRTEVLVDARVGGESPVDRLAQLAADHLHVKHPIVADIGPGLGETTEWLARDLTPARLLALDIAPAMLTAVRDRLGTAAELVRADFNALPLADQRFDLAVLWFCVYHSSHPDQVLAEVRRILRPGALALFATKGPQSYASMDELVRRAGLDDNPRDRPSLYRTFNSHNFLDVVGQALDVVTVHHVDHEFVFDDPAALARYVVTSPRYSTYQQIPLAQVERRLAAVWPGQRFHTYSRLSYCAGRRGT